MNNTIYFRVLFFLFLAVLSLSSMAQQLPDTSFTYNIRRPAYEYGKGPCVLIDAAHNNFHTKGGGFFAFSRLLEKDGYRTESLDNKITEKNVLKDCRILVISNPLNEYNDTNWTLPVYSAFTEKEVAVLKSWVENGGSLLLIADHMPFAGAAYGLAKAFGFEFVNGFAYTGKRSWPPSIFSVNKGTLLESEVTIGMSDYGKIDSVATFTGSAFKAPEGAVGILKFLPENYSLQPDTAWSFSDNTGKISLDGYWQGAVMNFGRGRVAVFGEAAMFTAQVANGRKVGFNSETAPQNAQFVLNLIHWLDQSKEK